MNRVQVKTSRGAQWLTQPVLTTGRYLQQIHEVEFAEPDWGLTHARTLRANYGRAPFFQPYFQPLADLLLDPGRSLTTCNERLIHWICDLLDVRTTVVRASALGGDARGATQRLVQLVQAVGGDTYISGSGGFAYQDLSAFHAAGLRVVRAPATFPEYPQLWDPFVPGLSIVDLLFNCGPRSRAYLEGPCTQA